MASGPSALCLPAPQPFGGLRYQQTLWDDALVWIASILQRVCAPAFTPGSPHQALASPEDTMSYRASGSQAPCPMPACYPSRPCAPASPGASGMAVCSCMLVGWKKETSGCHRFMPTSKPRFQSLQITQVFRLATANVFQSQCLWSSA